VFTLSGNGVFNLLNCIENYDILQKKYIQRLKLQSLHPTVQLQHQVCRTKLTKEKWRKMNISNKPSEVLTAVAIKVTFWM
jgi:sulfur relay (sulfurtransferase) DsrF/TusC family protein